MARQRSIEDSIVYNKKRKRWIGRITTGYEGKKQIRKQFSGMTEAEVQQKIKKYRRDTFHLSLESDKVTFGEYYYRWLYGMKQADLKERSFVKYETLWNLYISKAPFKDDLVRDIKYSDIKVWYSSLQSRSKPRKVSVKTVEYINLLVRACFAIAKADGLTMVNPTDGIKFREVKRDDRIKAFSREEQSKFVTYLHSSQEPLKELLLFALGTGLRLGECLCLKWSDVDLQSGVVHVTRSLERVKRDDKYYDIESLPKTITSIRDVPLPEVLLTMLGNHESKEGLVFPNPVGNDSHYIFNKTPNRHVHAVCRKLGLPELTFHNLRHSYATRLFKANVQLKVVQRLLGHADIETTGNIYTHVMPDTFEAAVKSLNTFLESVT